MDWLSSYSQPGLLDFLRWLKNTPGFAVNLKMPAGCPVLAAGWWVSFVVRTGCPVLAAGWWVSFIVLCCALCCASCCVRYGWVFFVGVQIDGCPLLVPGWVFFVGVQIDGCPLLVPGWVFFVGVQIDGCPLLVLVGIRFEMPVYCSLVPFRHYSIEVERGRPKAT